MTSLSRLTLSCLSLAILLAAATSTGCSDTSNNTTPGSGGSGGSGGGAGSGGGGTGGGIPFMAVVPCSTEAAYTTTGTTVTFGGTDPGFNYAPKCLKVPVGSTVTFNGDFTMHPMRGSMLRGTMTGNPFPATSLNTGTTTTVTFPTAGFWGYYCSFHGADDGQFMDGVVWAN